MEIARRRGRLDPLGRELGLPWSDLDPVSQTIRIERTGTKIGRVKGVKTGEDREVDLNPRLAAALSGLQASLEADVMLAGQRGIDPWVFTTKPGTPRIPHRVAKTFCKVPAPSGLPQFRLYDLRHTLASHLIEQRADIAYVSRQMGHKKMTTTLLYYGHWFKQGDRSHIERMERVSVNALSVMPATTHDDQGLALERATSATYKWLI